MCVSVLQHYKVSSHSTFQAVHECPLQDTGILSQIQAADCCHSQFRHSDVITKFSQLLENTKINNQENFIVAIQVLIKTVFYPVWQRMVDSEPRCMTSLSTPSLNEALLCWCWHSQCCCQSRYSLILQCNMSFHLICNSLNVNRM